MNKRFSVRLDVKAARWFVWDSIEEKAVRIYPSSTKLSADSLCKYMNNNHKAVQA